MPEKRIRLAHEMKRLLDVNRWATCKGYLPGNEPSEWLHLYRIARIAPFALRGIADDPNVWVLSDLYDFLRDALEATDRLAVEGLIDDVP